MTIEISEWAVQALTGLACIYVLVWCGVLISGMMLKWRMAKYDADPGSGKL